jgi:RNA recognition motif-containing protein
MELGWGDIWKIFVKFGSVSDVYIPKKVDKWGRKFGFVKFKDVRDADELCKKLQEVWYGTTKLSVKRARFGKEDQKEEDSGTKTVLPRRRAALNVKVIEGVSFKSLLLKGKGARCAEVEDEGGVRRKSRLHSVEDLAPLQIEVCESTLKELEGSKVGFLKNSMDFSSFQERLMLDGHHEVKVIQMGGNMVLFQSPCEGELEEVMKCSKLWWENCFSKIIP